MLSIRTITLALFVFLLSFSAVAGPPSAFPAGSFFGGGLTLS
jgi:hypothetical protein